MNTPQIDPVTAESEMQDADIAGEHHKPSIADEQQDTVNAAPDESVPRDSGGSGGGMDQDDNRPL